MAVAVYDQINIRSGPSTSYASVGSLALGQSCPIIGRDTSTGWWLIRCANGVTGWVSPDVVVVVTVKCAILYGRRQCDCGAA